MTSTLFRPAEVTSAFLKMGLLGFQGSGKTKTAGKTAIGLVRLMKERGIPSADKPVMFLDTETGSDWLIPDFKAAGIAFHAAKTRAFSDLLIAVDEAEKNASVLIVDSVTHFWVELGASYMKKKNRTRLQFEDWAYLKQEWAKFTDRYVNSGLHIIIAGRAGFEYDYTVDEETQKKNLEKTGVKMKAEGEMGFEPSLLVLMERNQKIEASRVERVWRTATVLKDRSTLLDGQVFEDPDFDAFLPHVELLALGGKQLGVDSSRNSEHMIVENKRDWQPVQRRIVIDETETLLTLHHGGSAAAQKTERLKLILKHFNTVWTEIEEVMPLIDLRAGYDSLHRELEGKPSRYAALLSPATQQLEMNDELPDHSAPPAAASTTPNFPTFEQVLADIPNLATIKDCLSWALTVSNMAHLSVDQLAQINSELIKHQQVIAKRGNGSGEPGNGDGPEVPGKNDDGDAPTPQPTPPPKPAEERPAARKSAPKPANTNAGKTLAAV